MDHPGSEAVSRPIVLVVEDDDDSRESLAEVLRDEGYDVRTACDGVEALAHLNGADLPAAMVLDMRMPRMSGAEVLREVRARPSTAALPICVLSGDARGASSADLVIEKPLLVNRLVEVQRWLLECVGVHYQVTAGKGRAGLPSR